MGSNDMKPFDGVDILDIRSGDYITPGKTLREEILGGLTGDVNTETIVEEGQPIVKWNKRLPTGQLLPEINLLTLKLNAVS
jgi:hypothetical protein